MEKTAGSGLKKSVLILILVLTGLLFSCSEKEEVKEEIIRPVKYIEAFKAKNDIERTFSGVSAAGTVSRLSFRVGGKIEIIKTKNGDKVDKNQLMATLDNSDAKLEYEKIIAALNRSKIFRATAKSNLERVKSLYENDNISLQEYEAAKDEYANAEATWFADRRNAELQKKELSYYSLVSPAPGIVSGKSVEEGENVTAGEVIMEVHSSDKMEIKTGIPETYI